MGVERDHAALAEILRRGQDIISCKRLVGEPRAVAFDLASVAGNALCVEIRSANAEQRTWTPEEERPPQRKGRRA